MKGSAISILSTTNIILSQFVCHSKMSSQSLWIFVDKTNSLSTVSTYKKRKELSGIWLDVKLPFRELALRRSKKALLIPLTNNATNKEFKSNTNENMSYSKR